MKWVGRRDENVERKRGTNGRLSIEEVSFELAEKNCGGLKVLEM